MVGGQPGDGVPGCVLVFEGLLELSKKVVPGPEGNSGTVDGVLPEGFSPGLGGSLGHIRESKGDFLCVVAVRGLIDCKVELDGVHSRDSRFIGAIEGLRLAELQFGRFDNGG